MSSDLTPLSARELGRRIASRDLSAEEACRAYLERAATTEPSVGAYLSLEPEAALHRARSIDARLSKREPLSPLAGVPVAVKDTLCTRDQVTTCGSAILAGYRPPHDAAVVERLRGAGVLLLGKTNCDEFGMGSSTEHSARGRTANPWKLDRVPGGSSGGSAASVAVGSAAMALGSDTGGSVRQPAAFCGVVGLRPSYGRVSRRGLVAFASSLDQVGPLARDVADARALYALIAGHDPADATSSPRPASTRADSRSEAAGGTAFRFGVPPGVLGPVLAADVRREFERALEGLERAGGERVDVELPDFEDGLAAYQVIACAEASSNLARFDGVRFGHRCEAPSDAFEMRSRSRSEGFGDEVKRRILLGAFVLSVARREEYHARALRMRAAFTRAFGASLANCELIVTPTAPTTAFRFAERLDDPLAMALGDIYTVPASLAGLPALSMPCGFGDAGLPCGVQLIAARWQEKRLLDIATRLEGELGFDGSGTRAA